MAVTAKVTKKSNPPDSLSHYTNLRGFMGILDAGQLWASNVAYLNDREELLHGIKCANKALTRIVRDRNLASWKASITTVVQQIETGRMPNTYAACFCEKSDLLSQWRGYGGLEQGVSLCFEKDGLQDLQQGKKSYLARVEYGLVSGRQHITQGLQARLLAISNEELGSLKERDKEETVYRILSEIIPRFKHIGFKGEVEWRLVVQHNTLRNSVCFRAGRNAIIPYLKLGDAGGLLPLRYVRIGPGNEMALTQKSVEQYLEAKGYDVPVYHSHVPFRN